ncbi:IS1096 element passenger TnpR family protein [Sphingomonas pseudosanguinis]|uniref:IS1096 element passenger TnpR family protein n=1 Tax=Sphingomonas pseudosanguinis TaxID=413712 RepID=UPI000978A339|nr:hypothetical protein [Sphingomonas pseudosanguinis]OMJ30806.1 hypothetical protein BSZ14_16770 [Sphingomonas sp. Sph1(2015)]
MSKPAPLVAYRLKVGLRDISPMIWRRLLVRSDLTLFGLHRVIQIAFGWVRWWQERPQSSMGHAAERRACPRLFPHRHAGDGHAADRARIAAPIRDG